MAQDDQAAGPEGVPDRVAALGRRAADDEQELLRTAPPAVAPARRAGVAELKSAMAARGAYAILLDTPEDEVEEGVEPLWRTARARASELRAAAYRLMALVDRPDTGPTPPYKPGSNTHLATVVDHYGYEAALLDGRIGAVDDAVVEAEWARARADADAYKAALAALGVRLGLPCRADH